MTRIKKALSILILPALCAIIVITIQNADATAVHPRLANFNPGRIMDDAVFYDKDTMTVAQIQAFLDSKVPVCNSFTHPTRPEQAAPCLKDYRDVTVRKNANAFCNGYEGGIEKSAAEIIYGVSQSCGVNPQVILVKLQKEMGLVTDTWPRDAWLNGVPGVNFQYRSAMGYGCPDTALCDSVFYGFFNQVYHAAQQFKMYRANPQNFNFRAGRNNTVPFHPNASCGSSQVFIENQATAGLYNYTPHQPNAASLAAGYGQGNSCSSYGNRNFYLFFTDWFGSTEWTDTISPHPDGTLVDIDGSVYLIQNGRLRHIITGDIFESFHYSWSSIKRPTTGDRNLERGAPINSINQGVLYKDDENVYITVYRNGGYWRQVMSAASFDKLGFRWDRVRSVSESSMPKNTVDTPYKLDRHPDGTLITDGKDVFLLDHGTRRHVNKFVFESHNWDWRDVYHETPADKLLPRGANMLLREGTIIYDGANLFVIKIPPTGPEIKHPIGPWRCFSDLFGYSVSEALRLPVGALPANTGLTVPCL